MVNENLKLGCSTIDGHTILAIYPTHPEVFIYKLTSLFSKLKKEMGSLLYGFNSFHEAMLSEEYPEHFTETSSIQNVTYLDKRLYDALSPEHRDIWIAQLVATSKVAVDASEENILSISEKQQKSIDDMIIKQYGVSEVYDFLNSFMMAHFSICIKRPITMEEMSEISANLGDHPHIQRVKYLQSLL